LGLAVDINGTLAQITGAQQQPEAQENEVVEAQENVPDAQEDTAVDSRLFLDKMFPRVATPTLKAPAKQRVQAQSRQNLTRWSRRQRQAALKSSVPVSKCASYRLMRELELVGPDERILEAASKQYEVLFQGPLAPKSIAT
jgi:hypothetical protein